jgi:glycosyltransferase involved in cell wall biosynthesis
MIVPIMSKIKVALVANTDWYLYNFRLSLALYLKCQDYDVLMVSPPGKYAAYLEKAGFRWSAWPLGRKTMAPWKEIQALLQLAAIYRRERPNLVHHFTIKPVLYGSLAARFNRVGRVVNAITGLGYIFLGEGAKARLARKIAKSFYRLVLDRPDSAVIFENDADRRFFIAERLVSFERTHLIEGAGVDPVHYQPEPEPGPPPVIVLPSRLLWDKGVGVLVGASRILKQEGVAARIVLVGEPDPGNPASIDEKIIHDWVEEGLVEWWGWQQDMRKVYANSHIVALPSFGEGVPTALLEAAASGRPIVTTDVPGCRDVVVHGVNGLLAPPNDEVALARAFRELIEDPELRGRMGAAGRQRVLDKFTNSKVNAATEELYKGLLANV